MAPSRKHHFIPAFYLAQWAGANEELIEWSRPHREIVPHRRHPNATGFEYDLYSFPGLPPAARSWFEDHFLKSTDDLASQALASILAGRMDTLDALRKSGWARFLMTLRFRHPDPLAEARAGIALLWKHHDTFTRESYERVRETGDPETFEEYVEQLGPDGNIRVQLDLLVASMDNGQIGQHIVSMAWAVIDLSDASHQLLTSDWPVELSLGAIPPMVALPLTPSLLFVACDDVNTLIRLDRSNHDALVTKMNRYVVESARRYVFSSDERQKTFIRNRMSRSMVKPPFYPSFALLHAQLTGGSA